jgi:hypothetical protein
LQVESCGWMINLRDLVIRSGVSVTHPPGGGFSTEKHVCITGLEGNDANPLRLKRKEAQCASLALSLLANLSS